MEKASNIIVSAFSDEALSVVCSIIGDPKKNDSETGRL